MKGSSKRLVGKTIARVEMRPHRESRPGSKYVTTLHSPVITFTDGSTLTFVSEEHPDGAEPGVDFIFSPAPRRTGE